MNPQRNGARIVDIEADVDEVRVRCAAVRAGCSLIEATAWDPDVWEVGMRSNRSGSTIVRLPRTGPRGDRLLSRFRLSSGPATATACSRIDPSTGWRHAMPAPKAIKGLTCPVDMDDVIRLGAKWININLVLRDYVGVDPIPGEPAITVDGVPLAIRRRALETLDQTVRRATEAGIAVVAVLNNPISGALAADDPFVHPRSEREAAPNRLGAFNLTSRQGCRVYRGVLGTLARRYARPDRKHGWIHGYIVGNEVQQHSVWYNRGPVDFEDFLDEYERTVRATWLTLRDVHPTLKTYVSLDHHWSRARTGDPSREGTGKKVLEGLVRRSRAHGDFDWDVAFHPYPEDLFDPRFWRDADAPVAFDAGKVTFRNIEVLPAWLDRPENRCNGRRRAVILSEQGFHARAGTDGEALQAAAFAAAFARVQAIPGIDAFMLHRHVSHRDEGGLRLGLRDFDPSSADPSSPGRALPSWHMFQAAETPGQDAAFASAVDLVGRENWKRPLPARSIPEHAPVPPKDPNVVFDFVESFPAAERRDVLDARTVQVEDRGRVFPAIFQHPGPSRRSELHYRCDLPQGPCTFEFGVGFTAPSANGARFSVEIDGVEAWALTCAAGPFVTVSVPVPPASRAGSRFALRVDPLGDITHDWCVWVAPRILRSTRAAPAKGSP